jgi:AhpD family alkylhydroperoxidase
MHGVSDKQILIARQGDKMQTIHPVKMENVSVATQRLLDAASAERGVLTNMIKTLAQSPRALEGYLQFKTSLNGTSLSPATCEQIALAVAQTNLSEYSLAEHAHFAAKFGLKREQIVASRDARSMDRKTDAMLRFARDLAASKSDFPLVELRERGCSDAEIVDLIAYVALNVFENYLNEVAQTDLDFPKVERSVRAA